MYILKKGLYKETNHLLRLNRTNSELEVYQLADNSILSDNYSIRPDFDSSDYLMYEKIKSIDCIFGSTKSPTPTGVFQIEKKSSEEYISGYYKKIDKVKFFGYLVIFEDYFIHSNLYEEKVTKNTMDKYIPVSTSDKYTAGCIRVSQNEVDWLLENIEVGTTVIL